jgi:hypothetical protein
MARLSGQSAKQIRLANRPLKNMLAARVPKSSFEVPRSVAENKANFSLERLSHIDYFMVH